MVLDGGFLPCLTFSLDCDFLSPFAQLGYNTPLDITFGQLLVEEDEDHVELGLIQSDTQYIMNNVCRSLPLTNIQSLHVSHPHEFSSDFLGEILRHLDGLRSMKLSDGAMPAARLVSALSSCSQARSATDS